MPLRVKNASVTPDALQTSWPISVAGAQAGDVAILQHEYRGGSGVTVTTPTGWTLIRNDPQSTTVGQAWFWKHITSAGTVSVTATISAANNMALTLSVWSGRDTTNPVNASNGQGNASASTAVAPAATTNVDGCDILVGYGLTAAVNQTVAPSGFTKELDEETTGGGGNVTVVLNSGAQTTQGTTGPHTATLNGSTASVGATIALAPAPVVGGGLAYSPFDGRGAFGHEPPSNITTAQLAPDIEIIFPNRNSGNGFMADARAVNPSIACAIYISVSEVRQDQTTPQSTIMFPGDFAALQEQDFLHSVPNGGIADRIYDASFKTHFIDPASPRFRTIWKTNWPTIRNSRSWCNGLYFDNLESIPNNWLRASPTGRAFGIGNLEYTRANYGPALAAMVLDLVTTFRATWPNDQYGGNILSFDSSIPLFTRWGFLDFWAPEATVGYGTTYPTVADLRNRILQMQQFVAAASRKIIISNGYTKLNPPDLSLTQETAKIDFFLAFHYMVMPQQANVTVGGVTWPRDAVRWYNHKYDAIWIVPRAQMARAIGRPTALAVENPSGVFTRTGEYGTVVCDLNAKSGTFTITSTPPPTGVERRETFGGAAPQKRLMNQNYVRPVLFTPTRTQTPTTLEIVTSTDPVPGATQPLRWAIFTAPSGAAGKPGTLLGETERRTFSGDTPLTDSPEQWSFTTSPGVLTAGTPYYALPLSGAVTSATVDGFIRLAQNPDEGTAYYDDDIELDGYNSPFDPDNDANGPFTSTLVFTLIETVTPPSAPAVPTGFTGTAPSPNVALLQWTDTSTTETGFIIHRSQASNFAAFEVIEVAANATTYPDTQVAGGTTYYYKIQAVDTVNDLQSAFSDVITVTTPRRPPPAAAPQVGQGEYLIIVRTPGGEKIDEISSQGGDDRHVNNKFLSLAYSKKRRTPGLLEFELPANHPIIAQLQDKSQIEVLRRNVAADLPWYTDFHSLYRKGELWMDERGQQRFRASCPGLLHMLSWRVVAYFAGILERTAFTAKPLEYIIKTLVVTNAGAAAMAGSGFSARRRAGAIPGLVVEPNQDRGPERSWSGAWGNLLTVIQDLAADGGDFDLVKIGPAAWQFRYYDLRGQDLTESVTFSLGANTLRSPRYLEDHQAEATVAIIGGPGDDTERVMGVVSSSAYAVDNDIETWVDASQAATLSELDAAGATALAERRAVRAFTFDVGQTASTLYGKHYAVGGTLGDRVRGTYAGRSATMEIVGVQVSLENDGAESIGLELLQIGD